jgi:myo-inositol-1(or 4)-monophosphatase
MIDGAFARWLASRAGQALLDLRTEMGFADAGALKSAGDKVSHDLIRTELAKWRPGDAVLSEEDEGSRLAWAAEVNTGAVSRLTADRVWIIDPLDGTTNFLHAIPHFAIALALQEDKEIIAGVVYNPVAGDLFYAEKGGGAWAMTASGSCRLHVSERNTMKESLVVTGIPHLGYGNPDEFIPQLIPMMQKTAGVRRMGSASLDMAYVAAGRFECYWEHGIKPWDIAAGMVILKEAGGRFCTLNGIEDPFTVLTDGSIIATNDHLFNTVKKQLMAAQKDEKK